MLVALGLALVPASLVLVAGTFPPTAKIISQRGGYTYVVVPPTDTLNVDTLRDAKYPLVVSLHGKSLSGNKINALTKYGTIAAINAGLRLPAYVVAPQCPSGKGWNPDQIMEIVNTVTREYAIDTNRIYVLGMSMGGYGTFDLVGTYPEKFAAAIAMCGGGKQVMASNLARVPLWVIHGASDVDVPVSQSRMMVTAICSKKDNKCFYTELPRIGHSALAESYNHAKLYEWMFAHRKDDVNSATPAVKEPPSYTSRDFSWLKYTNATVKKKKYGKKRKHAKRRRTRR
jgi:hypothetical protein